MPRLPLAAAIALLAGPVGVLLPSLASGLTLAHDDLVALGTGDAGLGIYRIDSTTGDQALIAGGSYTDVAVRGAHRIYATRSGEVVEIDPETGSSTVIAAGYTGSLSVTVNRTGDVFVLEAEYGGATRLHRVDAEARTSQLVLTSAFAFSDVIDLELLDETTPIALAQGGPLGTSSEGGVVAFDGFSGLEQVLVDSSDVASVLGPGGFPAFGWAEPTGLGVTSDGRVLVSCDGDFDCGLWAYDPETDQLEAVGVEDVYGVGPYGSVDWNDVDIAALSNGDLFISTFNVRADTGGDPALSGIHRLEAGACPFCAPGSDRAASLVDGEPFSPGSWTEIQVVDAEAPIPEPGAFLVFALGMALVSARTRGRAGERAR